MLCGKVVAESFFERLVLNETASYLMYEIRDDLRKTKAGSVSSAPSYLHMALRRAYR